MDGKWGPALPAGEEVLWEGRLHPAMLGLPALFLGLGAWQLTPWAFAPAAVGLLFIGFGLVAGALFHQQWRWGLVALTPQRLMARSKQPGKNPRVKTWPLEGVDGFVPRGGVFGPMLGYGHIILTYRGRCVGVLRGVQDPKPLMALLRGQIETRKAAHAAQ